MPGRGPERSIRYDVVSYRNYGRHSRLALPAVTPDRRKWVVLGVMIISLVAIVLDNTKSQLEWAINSYTLVFAGLLFTFGVIGDRVGRKRMLITGMALFGLASLVSSYAQTPAELIGRASCRERV